MRFSSAIKSQQPNSSVIFNYIDATESIKIGNRKINSPFGQYWQVTVWIEAQSTYGHGRSENLETATLKAISELFERVAMDSFFRENQWPSCQNFEANEITFQLTDKAPPEPVPFKIHTSNGWAVHTLEARSFENAFLEAAERHLLLLNYLSNGWRGFTEQKAVNEGLISRSLIGNQTQSGLAAGFAILKGEVLPGISLGHICDLSSTIGKSTLWKRAFFEAHTLMTVYEDLIQKNKEIEGDDFIKIGAELISSPHELPCLENFESNLSSASPNFNFSSYVFDLQGYFNLPFELYGSFVFGGNLIPLYLCNKLDKNSREYICRALSEYGIEDNLSEQPPVL